MSKTSIALTPIAGFCVKSSTLEPGVYTPPSSINSGPNYLEAQNGPIPVPIGLKVFINIAWEAHVPPPPAGSEEAIQRAIKGEDVDELNPDGWYVPVIVSEGREDKDKELALQRLEAQSSLSLSRQISIPNIASKGKLLPRTVVVPSFLVNNPPAQPLQGLPLIQEITPTPTPAPLGGPSHVKLKGILKTNAPNNANIPSFAASTGSKREKPAWTWLKEDSHLKIVVSIPSLPPATIAKATLDLEPRRFVLNIPGHPVLDVNLGFSDAEIVATSSSKASVSLHEAENDRHEPNNALTLKRQRELDVDGATAEWRVAEGILVILA